MCGIRMAWLSAELQTLFLPYPSVRKTLKAQCADEISHDGSIFLSSALAHNPISLEDWGRMCRSGCVSLYQLATLMSYRPPHSCPMCLTS